MQLLQLSFEYLAQTLDLRGVFHSPIYMYLTCLLMLFANVVYL